MKRSDIHALETHGRGDRTLVLLHGYGCDKTMWNPILPYLEPDYRIVVYDLMGCGQSDLSRYDKARYDSLEGHADDLVALLEELGLDAPVLVGHSVSAMTIALAAIRMGSKVGDVVMVCPSPSFINDGDYQGGFERADILSLLETLEANYLGWSSEMAPAIMGTPDKPEHGETLTNSFCQADPEIARHFARVTFLSDHRADMARLENRTLILECRDDVIVPPSVGPWMKDTIADSQFVMLDATGHCPHISYPEQTAAAIRDFLATA